MSAFRKYHSVKRVSISSRLFYVMPDDNLCHSKEIRNPRGDIMGRFILIFFFFISIYPGSGEAGLKWKFKTDGRVYSSPLIAGDKIYFGSGDEYFYALNKESGNQEWQFKTGGAVHSSAVINANLVYFASADGNLYALDKNTGEMVWKFASGGEKMYGLWDYYLSSPAVENNRVYWGSGDGHLYAVDANNGDLQWKYDTGDIVHATPVIYQNKVYFGGFDGYMYALGKDDGSLVWKFKTVGASYFPKGEIQKAALVKDDVVYFGSRDYNIYALDTNTGRGKWNLRQPRGWIIATPLEYDGNLYFGTSDAHVFYSMEKNNGTVNWTIPLNMRVYGTATVSDGLIYFGTFDGKVLGIDPSSGETRWQFQTESSKLNYHTVYDENGAFKEGFELYGSDYLTPEKMIHALGSVLSSPAIENRVIYFGSSDGNLYAVDLP
jgi:outer membrane protein assembly factor BamB